MESEFHILIYSNLVLFGFAFQAGFIPLKFGSICSAIQTNSKNSEMSLNAFNLGRRLYIDNTDITKTLIWVAGDTIYLPLRIYKVPIVTKTE